MSPGVMVGFTLIVDGMTVTPRPVLWSEIDLEVEDPSWSGAVCHSMSVELVQFTSVVESYVHTNIYTC